MTDPLPADVRKYLQRAAAVIMPDPEPSALLKKYPKPQPEPWPFPLPPRFHHHAVFLSRIARMIAAGDWAELQMVNMSDFNDIIDDIAPEVSDG